MLSNFIDKHQPLRPEDIGSVWADIGLLADLAILGSSNPYWTRERIDAKVDENIAGIKVQPRWEPWMSVEEAAKL
jgi:hypothetical protein